MGRFISQDPLWGNIRDPQSLNRFAYGRNNPYRYKDPTGKMTMEQIGGYSVTDGDGGHHTPAPDENGSYWGDGGDSDYGDNPLDAPVAAPNPFDWNQYPVAPLSPGLFTWNPITRGTRRTDWELVGTKSPECWITGGLYNGLPVRCDYERYITVIEKGHWELYGIPVTPDYTREWKTDVETETGGALSPVIPNAPYGYVEWKCPDRPLR